MFGLAGALPRDATVVAIALFGAMIGFAPFNRPVARLFLGDVGSLPIGLILGWLLLLLAAHGHLAAALLLPLYYLADATITLLRRLIKGDLPTQAHRDHFYQRAIDDGIEHLPCCWFCIRAEHRPRRACSGFNVGHVSKIPICVSGFGKRVSGWSPVDI